MLNFTEAPLAKGYLNYNHPFSEAAQPVTPVVVVILYQVYPLADTGPSTTIASNPLEDFPTTV